eukprot:243780-Prymnesium_polylepis.1
MAYDAPCGAVTGATRALRCRGWHEMSQAVPLRHHAQPSFRFRPPLVACRHVRGEPSSRFRVLPGAVV